METVIASVDEFELIKDESDFVHLMDGEQTVRVSIPLNILQEIAKQVLSH